MGVRRKDQYVHSSIDRAALGRFVAYAKEAGSRTTRVLNRYGFRALPDYGSAQAVEVRARYIGSACETIGTKQRVVDHMRPDLGNVNNWWRTIGWDAVSAVVNDVLTRGMQPFMVCMDLAAGKSSWFEDELRCHSIIDGWVKACLYTGCMYGQGETSVEEDIVMSESFKLSGSAVAFANDPRWLVKGDIEAGDIIIFFASSGLHTNGFTRAHRIALAAPCWYETRLSDGQMYGSALLERSVIYAPVVIDCLRAGVPIHHAVHVTGKAWLKFMDAPKPFVHIIDVIPEPMPIFQFIQEHGKLSDKRMYVTFNMGVGFALYVPETFVRRVLAIAATHSMHAWSAGYVEEHGDDRRVIINPKKIEFLPSALYAEGQQ